MGTRAIVRLPALGLAAALAGCSGGLGGLGEILTAGGGQPAGGQVVVEVQEVRESNQQIIVRTEQGDEGPVLYDANTRVIYQNQEYPVRSLERGDVVEMRVQEVQQGYYTDLIQVRTPVQERMGGTRTSPQPNVYRVEGTVGDVDTERWVFTLNMTQGGTVPVHLSSSAPASARDRLRDMRPGDYVRVEVRPIDEQRAELVRFGWS